MARHCRPRSRTARPRPTWSHAPAAWRSDDCPLAARTAVGWAKVLALLFNNEGLLVRRATRSGASSIEADGGHGARQALPIWKGSASAHSPSKTGVNALMANPTSVAPRLIQ